MIDHHSLRLREKKIPIDVIVTQARQVVCFQAPVQNYFTRNCNGTTMKLQIEKKINDRI